MLMRRPHETDTSLETFEFRHEWNDVLYAMKQVRPIFVDDPGEIVVVTVYVYYFNGERL